MILKLLSRMSMYVMDHRLSRHMIKTFADKYNIAIDEAEKEIHQYQSLNEFFSRRLKTGSRPIDPDPKTIISPVDGFISQYGTIEDDTLIQAKGISYRLEDLLDNDERRVMQFRDGNYMTIYLSPQNYHRIHSPYSGQIEGFTYIPGTFFPVNEWGTGKVKGLFAKNERIVTYICTEAGAIAVIKVGAFLVGSVQLLYHRPFKRKGKRTYIYQKDLPQLQKGDELGYFQFGSTVICLFEKGMAEFAPSIKHQPAIQMGRKIATVKASQTTKQAE